MPKLLLIAALLYGGYLAANGQIKLGGKGLHASGSRGGVSSYSAAPRAAIGGVKGAASAINK